MNEQVITRLDCRNMSYMKIDMEDGTEEFTIPYPLTLEQVPLNKHIDFLEALNLVPSMLPDLSEGDTPSEQQKKEIAREHFNQMIINAVSKIFGMEAVQRLPFVLQDNENEKEVSVLRLYVHYMNICSDAWRFGVSERLMYKGEEWCIKSTDAKLFDKTTPNLTANEFIAALDVERVAMQKAMQENSKIDDVVFSMPLSLIAIFVRKEGETLPIEYNERNAFIDQRMVHFQDINAASAIAMRSFFGIASLRQTISQAVGEANTQRNGTRPKVNKGTMLHLPTASRTSQTNQKLNGRKRGKKTR